MSSGGSSSSIMSGVSVLPRNNGRIGRNSQGEHTLHHSIFNKLVKEALSLTSWAEVKAK